MIVVKKWIGIAGSWRKTNDQVEQDVRACVRDALNDGGRIVTGGALGVDYFATDEVLKLDPTAGSIKIFLPVTLALYSAHYRKRADEGVIAHQQAENLISQLERVKSACNDSVIENKVNTEVNKDTYFEKITSIVNSSDELIAFDVNKTEGTQDTIKKAKTKGIPVKVFTYKID